MVKSLTDWWHSIPSWAKPVILAFLLPVGYAVLRLVPAMIMRIIHRHYKRVLNDVDSTREGLLKELRDRNVMYPIIPDEDVVAQCGHREWIVKKAREWEKDKRRFG